MDWGRQGKAMCTSFNPLDCKQFETFTLDPLIGDNLARVRVTIGCLRGKVIAVEPVLANGPFCGTECHYAGGSELDFISHDKTPTK
jgi:hypothetical protein